MNEENNKNNISIMIVEDENIVALDMRYRLEAFGYSVCAVIGSGEIAVSEVKALKPDLVLMDIQLKGAIDGIESARLIHSYSSIPIVFVTAFTDDVTLEKVKASDAYGYIVKPYHERELRIAIELALSKQRYEQGLRIAKEAAEASDKAKTRFLSNISHELKTPLNAIIGFMDLASGTNDTGEVAEYLLYASQGARKLETIIDSILDYTKLEFGELAPIQTEFELEQFLVDCWMPFTGDANAKGIGVRMYVDPDLPRYIFGDAGKLKIIVRNLLDNSVKFTDSGFILLSANRVYDAEKTCLNLSVSDTGSGIPQEQLSVAFALFTQIDDSSTRAAGGMGLGLPLSKALADLLQVHMECSSAIGRGTKFSLRIELPSASAPAWPHPGDGQLRHVGLYGKSCARDELFLWAPRFKIELHDAGDGTEGLEQCDAVIADCTDFMALKPEVRASLAGICNGNLLLLGERCRKTEIPDDEDFIRLPYPLRLGDFIKSIDKMLGRTNNVIHDMIPEGEPGSIDLREDTTLSNACTGIKRNYEKLVHLARSEASAVSMVDELENLLSTLCSRLRKEELADLERQVKIFHNFAMDWGGKYAPLFLL